MSSVQRGKRSSNPTMSTASKGGFRNFDHGATDVVLAAEFNPSGSHLVVCSADHRIRLFMADQRDTWSLIDQWRGHDAEILDASLFNPIPHCFR